MESLDKLDPNPLLATMARFFARDGAAIEVAILANAEAWFYLEDDITFKH
ncbi:MAG: hypothetical protein U0703_00435 [Anaerolineae bacterium]